MKERLKMKSVLKVVKQPLKAVLPNWPFTQ